MKTFSTQTSIQVSSMILLILLTFCSCIEGDQKAPDADHAAADSGQVSTTDSDEKISLGYADFALIGDIEKKLDSSTSQEEISLKGCDQWTFIKTDLRGILTKMEQVSSETVYHLCYQYPCSYEGQAGAGDTQYTLSIHSSSYITLRNEKEELFFILKTPSDLFLDPCDCCDN